MAKAAVLEDETTEVELTPKQIINEGITRFIDETEVEGTHFRYKALRAIAYQAFVEAIDAEDFDGLVDRAIAGADDLPFGFEIEVKAKEEAPAKPAKAPAKKTAAKTAAKSAPTKAAAKPTAKTPAKAAGRRRPARKSAE